MGAFVMSGNHAASAHHRHSQVRGGMIDVESTQRCRLQVAPCLIGNVTQGSWGHPVGQSCNACFGSIQLSKGIYIAIDSHEDLRLHIGYAGHVFGKLIEIAGGAPGILQRKYLMVVENAHQKPRLLIPAVAPVQSSVPWQNDRLSPGSPGR